MNMQLNNTKHDAVRIESIPFLIIAKSKIQLSEEVFFALILKTSNFLYFSVVMGSAVLS